MASFNKIEVLTPILNELHLKWVTLNDKCKTLQSSLTKVTSKNEELEMKLIETLERSKKVEEENKKLKLIVKKMQKKFLTGSVHKVISTLKQTIRVYDETVLPSVSKLTKNVAGIDDDLNISSSDEENYSCCLSVIENHKSPAFSTVDKFSKLIDAHVNHVEVSQSQSPICKVIDVRSQMKSPKDIGQVFQETILDTNCSSKISSTSITSSKIVEKYSGTPQISNTQSTKDKYISSTTTSLNVPATNKPDSELPAVLSLNVVAISSQNFNQPSYIDISDIESCVIEEEQQILKSCTSSPVRENFEVSMNETFLHSHTELHPLDQREKKQENSNNKNCEEEGKKQKIVGPSEILVEDISCSTIEVETSESETNQSAQLKRPCSSLPSCIESSPKHFAPKKLGRSTRKQLKCLICEYDDFSALNDKTFESQSLLDQHIIEKHSDPAPCYIPCMFNDGKCTTHFHAGQKFNKFDKHVKQAHSHEDLDSVFKSSQRKPLKCFICAKLFLFERNVKEHCARVHGSVPNENKNSAKKTPNARQESSKFKARECEVCKKENRLSVKYRLYDELDSHIANYHSDPFPDYLRCPYCTRHFKSVKWLTHHIMNKHPFLYINSPLEKFHFGQGQGGDEQGVENNMDMESNITGQPSTSTEAPALRILSPTSINKSILLTVKSITVPT